MDPLILTCLGTNGIKPGNGEQAVVFTEYADTADWLVGALTACAFTARRYSGRAAPCPGLREGRVRATRLPDPRVDGRGQRRHRPADRARPCELEHDRPEVDRAQLRQILLDSLPPGVVRWGHAPKSVEAQSDGTFELIFANGSAPERFDLLVGADGAWSQVRPLVSSVQPEYEGILFVEFHLADVDTQHLEIAEMVGHGKMFAFGDCKGILAQRNSNGHVYACAAFRAPQTWLSNFGSELSPAAAKAKLISVFEDWSQNLLRFIYESDDQMIARPLSFLPVGHSWENHPGVTLLGDAAHVMSPFSGEGANLAMRDAADLALGLADCADWKAAVARFERVMFNRASVAAAAALTAMRDVFSEAGLEHALEQMRSHHPQTPTSARPA